MGGGAGRLSSKHWFSIFVLTPVSLQERPNYSKEESKRDFIPAFGYHFLTPFYESINRLIMGRLWKAVAQKVVERAPEKVSVLDLGCGPGTVLRLIRDRRLDLRLTGIDIDPKILAIAKKKAEGKNIAFRQSSLEELPVENGSVDIALSTLAFHHLREATKRKSFREVKRILGANGLFFLCDFSVPLHRVGRITASLHSLLEPETLPQMKGQFFTLAEETGATLETLRTFYGCISLHCCTFPPSSPPL